MTLAARQPSGSPSSSEQQRQQQQQQQQQPPPPPQVVYVAVFDTVYSEHGGFGMSTSSDGLHWSKGVDVALPGGCRTPLGIIDEGDGYASMLFTRRYR